METGEQAIYDVGVHGLHPELVKLVGRMKWRTSYGQNILLHSKEVAWLAAIMATELGLDVSMARRGALLHDIGKVLTHEHEGTHVQLGVEVATKYGENPLVVNCIAAHHDDVPHESEVSVLVQAADAISGSRPGARREAFETYVKRLEGLEKIASSYKGVEKVFAIQAGREVRVIVTPDDVDDVRMGTLTEEIARRIEAELQYPGQIKVVAIRETRAELVSVVQRLNRDQSIHGILVQMPLPKQIDADVVLRCIDPAKDVDGFHPINVGRLFIGDQEAFAPCTPAGVMVMLREYRIPVAGQHVVIVGRSMIVGKPMAALLVQPGVDATVTICHSRTRDLADHTRRADILVAAVGRAEMITGDMVKPGATIIDVGINRVSDTSSAKGYRLVGDVHFESARHVASHITPVPGGVGAMTIAMLMDNTLKAASRIAGIHAA